MMLLFSINTFWSLTQALSTLRKVWVARLTAMLIASSKLWSEMALISVTRATVITTPFFRFPCRESPTPYREGIKLEAQCFWWWVRSWRGTGAPFLTFPNSEDTRPLVVPGMGTHTARAMEDALID